LTVVTPFGLVGTVTTGVLGVNLFAFADQTSVTRFLIFLIVFVLTFFLTLYTIMKSRRLSDFLEALSDEKVTWRRRRGSLLRVWFGRS
jgi:uncharacterized membrane protein YcaP (DUF421 family)